MVPAVLKTRFAVVAGIPVTDTNAPVLSAILCRHSSSMWDYAG